MQPEADRIAEAYKRYASDEAVQARRDLANPGNKAVVDQRDRLLCQFLCRNGLPSLAGKLVLDIGCGTGGQLAKLLELGLAPTDAYGVDLLADRINAARSKYPDLHFECGDAGQLTFLDATFDIVILFTILSSIIDDGMAIRVSAEAARVLKAGGAVLWYDFRYPVPYNPSVRAITLRDLRRYFPGFALRVRTTTLLPPLARRLGRLTAVMYPLLCQVPALRSHYLALCIKP